MNSGIINGNNFVVVLLSALLFGFLTFRNLTRIWNYAGRVNKRNIVFALFWWMAGQAIMYVLAVWSYPDI